MTKYEIADRLARERVVEQLVCNIARTRLSSELADLCQMVYLILLEYDEDKIVDLWEHGEIKFFLARIILNQFHSVKSPYHALFRRWQTRWTGMDGHDIEDDGQ